VHGDIIFGRRFGICDIFFILFICVDARIFCGLLCVVCACDVNGSAEFVTSDKAAAWRRLGEVLHLSGGLGLEPPVFLSLQNIFGAGVTAGVGSVRYAYQLVAKPGWVLISTFFFGGSVTLRVESSSGALGCMASLEASDSSHAGEVMVMSHLFLQPGRSADTKQVGSDLLLKTASKNYAPSLGRRSASSDVLRSLAARRTGRTLQGQCCNFLYFRGCLCKNLDVTTKKYI
jgi:hypothetical protein